jgi:hypothetical protein
LANKALVPVLKETNMEPGNILKIETLSEEWRDKDSVMLHACFQLLKDFVEKEDVGHMRNNWNMDEEHKAAKTEIDELYNWWLSYSEPAVKTVDIIEQENAMLIRLINVRWTLWT